MVIVVVYAADDVTSNRPQATSITIHYVINYTIMQLYQNPKDAPALAHVKLRARAAGMFL